MQRARDKMGARGAGVQPVDSSRAHTSKTGATWGVLSALLASLALTSPSKADDALNSWEAQRKTFENLVHNMPPLNKQRVEDILHVRVDNNCLVVRTGLATTTEGGFMQTRLEGITGTALVLVQQKEPEPGTVRRLPTTQPAAKISPAAQKPAAPPRQEDGYVEPASFTLSITDYSIPRQTTSIVVNSTYQPNQFSISRSIQLTDGRFNQVILTQQRNSLSIGGGSLQLIVTDAKVAGAAPTQLNFEAPDFFTFLREHPHEANQYLRPLLREVGQEAVFAPEPMVAWQIFSDLWKPDARSTQKVQELLPRLDDPNYQVRNDALRKLHSLGSEGAAVMVHMDRSRLSPEQNTRIDRALVQYAQLPPREAARLRSDPAFLLDCLYSDDRTIRQAALERLIRITRTYLPFDVNADAVTRAKSVAILRQQLLGQPRSGR